ncbi:MAG: amidohydrolase family protein [Opitutaceae bacterium]
MPGIMEFTLDPRAIGLPSRDELVEMRIWDSHYHGISQHADVMPYFDRMGVERVFCLDVGFMRRTKEETESAAEKDFAVLGKWKERMSGLCRVDPARVDDTLEHLDRCVRHEPCIGIKTGGYHDAPMTVAHRNFDPIVRLLAEVEAVIYIHAVFQVGGTPRKFDGGNRADESSPRDVAALAVRFPNVKMICGHQGTDWELGIRQIRPYKNVYMEFAGWPPESGSLDFAVKELGVDRIVWGCHAPSRSFANSLSQVYDADLTAAQRKLIFGTNLRKLSAGIHRRKGIKVDV